MPVNGDCFLLSVEKMFTATLQTGDLLVFENLGGPKNKAVRRSIRAAGAPLLFPPKYSPDLNLIGQPFAPLNPWLRDAGCKAIAPIPLPA